MKILREVLWPLAAVFAAFVVGGIIVLLIGDNPFTAFYHLIGNSFGSLNDIGYTLFLATPFIFTGLAVAVAFRCGLLNIGAEGQFTWRHSRPRGSGSSSAARSSTSLARKKTGHGQACRHCCLSRCVSWRQWSAGGIWGAIPGILKAKFGSHEVINTIMLNFVAVALVSYFTQYYYKIPGDPIMQTAEIGQNAHIPRISQFIPGMPDFVPLSVAFLIGDR